MSIINPWFLDYSAVVEFVLFLTMTRVVGIFRSVFYFLQTTESNKTTKSHPISLQRFVRKLLKRPLKGIAKRIRQAKYFLRFDIRHLILISRLQSNGKNIFITGGTGFLGKALIEKLLRSCPDLNKIYILVREKKGKLLHERVNELLSSPLFSLLMRTHPENVKKIIPIAGDIKELGLGLFHTDKLLLKEEIHVVLHCAASIRFDDFIREGIVTNLRGVREVAYLALEMKQLEIFVHVSTAFCNMDIKRVVDEILYPPHDDWKNAIAVAESCDTDILNTLSRKCIGVFPNTYTYTKQLAEHCVNDLLVGKVPTIIYRPTAVIASLVDPYQGWCDSINGPYVIMVAGSSGLLKILFSNPDMKTDYVPVDFVVKSIIVAVWNKFNSRDKEKLDVYHGSTNSLMSLSADKLVEMGEETFFWNIPIKQNVWYPKLTTTNNSIYYFINVIFLHVIPAILLDLVLKVVGHKPIVLKLQRKIYLATNALTPFITNEWFFENKKTFGLIDQIPKEEMFEFNFKIFPTSKVNMHEYIFSSLLQIREHVLKEGKNTDSGYTRHLRMYILDKILRVLFKGLFIWIAFFKLDLLSVIWRTTCRYFEILY